ncbi:hypothetical protein KSP40_PGU007601 [Platanthera guangdongensis]|uniref:Uncharacterized protein n=1 Tax=Platanthera guangdongensis TaxID=2320717 RepID=A0ABR2LGT2_9ASPA
MAAIGSSFAGTFIGGGLRTPSKKPPPRTGISCIGWDPEGILGPPRRLTKDFFECIQIELAKLRFSVSRTKEMEDRLIEFEALEKVLLEGIEAYDKMEGDLVLAKERLLKILQSKERNSTLLDMVERNKLTRSVLALLDENIADALKSDQVSIIFYRGLMCSKIKS